MATKEKEYYRLPGRGLRRHEVVSAMQSRLWLGKDHLLITDTQWYTQEYKRFYFRDIQAIIIRKTVTGKVINIIFGALTLLMVAAAIASGGDASIAWLCVAGVFGLILLINTIYGPTCVTHMRTAVQTEDLPTLRRLRRANKVMARVRPLIAAAQGELTAAEIPARMEQLARPTHAPASASAAPNAAPPVIAEVVEISPQPPPEAPLAG